MPDSHVNLLLLCLCHARLAFQLVNSLLPGAAKDLEVYFGISNSFVIGKVVQIFDAIVGFFQKILDALVPPPIRTVKQVRLNLSYN